MQKEEEIGEVVKLVSGCTRCGLHKTRTNAVFGEGSLDADIMLVGEAPGRNEDLQGRPFVGKAGKFLDELLESAGIDRGNVYICNILKCRPPGNRNPKAEEIKACTPYLDRQIAFIRPRVICPMGNFAAGYILEKFGFRPESIGNIHGKAYKVRNLLLPDSKIIPLYHPASAVYNPEMRYILMDDFRKIRKECQED
jgi:uracil-DNA glycosylase family 4